MAAVDGRLHRRFVSFLGTEEPGSSVPDYLPSSALLHRNHQPVPLAVGMLFEPPPESLHRKRRRIKGDRRIQDVVVINLREPRQIGEYRRPGRDVFHSKRFSSRAYSTMGPPGTATATPLV